MAHAQTRGQSCPWNLLTPKTGLTESQHGPADFFPSKTEGVDRVRRFPSVIEEKGMNVLQLAPLANHALSSASARTCA
jgi:hypothetical protein